MSEFNYEKINSRVIRGESVYLAKVDSAETLRNIFTNEEMRYEVSVSDVKIQTATGTYTPAMLFTYCMEDADGGMHFVDIVISELLGTFGLLILALGAVLERSFKDAEKIIEKNSRTYRCSNDNDIVWLDFEDRSGTGRHMDM